MYAVLTARSTLLQFANIVKAEHWLRHYKNHAANYPSIYTDLYVKTWLYINFIVNVFLLFLFF